MTELGPSNPEHESNAEITIEEIGQLQRMAADLVVRPEDTALSLGLKEPRHIWTTVYFNDEARIIINIPEPGYDGADREAETSFFVRKQLNMPHPLGHHIFKEHSYQLDSETGTASHVVRTREYDENHNFIKPPRPQNQTFEEKQAHLSAQDLAERQLGLRRFTSDDFTELSRLLKLLGPDDVIT
jgi:hypothetical protein